MPTAAAPLVPSAVDLSVLDYSTPLPSAPLAPLAPPALAAPAAFAVTSMPPGLGPPPPVRTFAETDDADFYAAVGTYADGEPGEESQGVGMPAAVAAGAGTGLAVSMSSPTPSAPPAPEAEPVSTFASTASPAPQHDPQAPGSSVLLDDRYMSLISQSAKWSSVDIANVSDGELETAANGFGLLDVTRSGTLGPSEFERMQRVVRAAEGHVDAYPRSPEDVAASFANADMNGDGRVDFNEYLHFVTTQSRLSFAQLEAVLQEVV